MLTPEKIDSLWQKFSAFPVTADDFTKGSKQVFVDSLLQPNNIFYEIGDELGLASATCVRPNMDALVHLVMFDKRLRGRERLFTDILTELFIRCRLHRCTAVVCETQATARKLLVRLGFVQEGVMRQATLRNGEYLDLYVYGLSRVELFRRR